LSGQVHTNQTIEHYKLTLSLRDNFSHYFYYYCCCCVVVSLMQGSTQHRSFWRLSISTH